MKNMIYNESVLTQNKKQFKAINNMKEQMTEILEISEVGVKNEDLKPKIDLSQARFIFKQKTNKDFDSYYKTFYCKLVWMISKMSITTLDAEDIANQAFIRSLEKIEMYNPQYQFSTWVFDIAKKLAYQYKKVQHKTVCVERITEDTGMDEDFGEQSSLKYYINAVTATDDFEEKFIGERKLSEKYNLVLKNIMNLKDKYKEVIKLCDIEGLSYNEICNITGLKMQTVKNRLHHGRLKIENALNDKFAQLELQD